MELADSMRASDGLKSTDGSEELNNLYGSDGRRRWRRCVCVALPCLAVLLPPLCPAARAQAVSRASFDVRSFGPSPMEIARTSLPTAGSASGSVAEPVPVTVGTGSASLVSRALDAVLYATPATVGGSSVPAIGIQKRSWLTSAEEPLQLGFYSERQSLDLNYMDHLSAQQVGLTASGRLLGARLFGGAGLERVHTNTFHPDLPMTRRVFDAPGDGYGNPAVNGSAGYYDIDYAPHLTAGAAYEIGQMHIGAGVSFGVYSSLSLTAEVPLF